MENQFAEEPLSQARAENAKLREELDRALAAAQAAKDELQDFVYAASHDLKTPLRTISSYTQLLVRHCGEQEGIGDYVRFIEDGVRAITGVVEQLLRLSRAGSNPRISTINLASPLQNALFKLSAAVKASGAQITHGQLPEVAADDAQFTQVFEHLIDNAIKYRGADSPRIEITGEESDDGFLIAVRDNGAGIDPQFQKQVFVPFKRLHGTTIPGSGLGLAVSKKIVEAHGGTIWVESQGVGGSVFKILLPY